jgi:hypothetical protein
VLLHERGRTVLVALLDQVDDSVVRGDLGTAPSGREVLAVGRGVGDPTLDVGEQDVLQHPQHHCDRVVAAEAHDGVVEREHRSVVGDPVGLEELARGLIQAPQLGHDRLGPVGSPGAETGAQWREQLGGFADVALAGAL